MVSFVEGLVITSDSIADDHAIRDRRFVTTIAHSKLQSARGTLDLAIGHGALVVGEEQLDFFQSTSLRFG